MVSSSFLVFIVSGSCVKRSSMQTDALSEELEEKGFLGDGRWPLCPMGSWENNGWISVLGQSTSTALSDWFIGTSRLLLPLCQRCQFDSSPSSSNKIWSLSFLLWVMFALCYNESNIWRCGYIKWTMYGLAVGIKQDNYDHDKVVVWDMKFTDIVKFRCVLQIPEMSLKIVWPTRAGSQHYIFISANLVQKPNSFRVLFFCCGSELKPCWFLWWNLYPTSLWSRLVLGWMWCRGGCVRGADWMQVLCSALNNGVLWR